MRKKLTPSLQSFVLRCFLLYSSFFILSSSSSYAQVTNQWNRFIDYSNNANSGAKAIAKDAAGNMYITGAVNYVDRAVIYTTKYSPAGSILWIRGYVVDDANFDFRARGIAVTDDGFVYVIGNTVLRSSNVEFPDHDFILKYNSNDNSDNGALGVQTSNFTPSAIALDPDGNIYVTGTKWVTSPSFHEVAYTKKYNADFTIQAIATFNSFNSSANALAVNTSGVYVTGTTTESAGSGINIVTIKYNASLGSPINVRQYSGSANYNSEAFDIALDGSGNVFVTGQSTDGSSPGALNSIYTTIKYNAALEEQWVRKYDESSNLESGRKIVVDISGNIGVTGNSGEDVVTIKYANDGTQQWAKKYDGPAQANDIATDAFGNFYVTGWGIDDGRDIITFKYDAAGNEPWRIVFTSPNSPSDDVAEAMVVDGSGNVYVTGSASNRGVLIKYIQCDVCPVDIDLIPPVIVCPQAITVNTIAGQCYAQPTITPPTASDNLPGTIAITAVRSDDQLLNADYPKGLTTITWTATDLAGNEDICTQSITVSDAELPVITCPAPVMVSCAANVPVVNINSVTATDNCANVTVTHVGDIISSQTCTNKFTLTRTYNATDASGNSVTCSQVITVNDDTPPQITGLSATPQTLWPPNHTMRDVVISYQVSDNCVSSPNITISVSSNEPPNGTGDGDTDSDWEILDNHHVRLRAERAANGNGRIYTITLTINDGCNLPVSASTQVVVAHNITEPQSGNPFKIGSTVNFSGTFWDKPGNRHTSKWLVDNSAVATGTVTEPSGNQNGKVTGSYKFNSPGVYKLQMNVTDQNNTTSYANTNGDLEAIIVIYDPNGGYAYGGGYFASPAGALKSNPNATGKVSYGFAMNYFKNSTLPKGETQFEFKLGDLEYNALNFDYLSISGAKAQFKGTGKIIGGQSGINFIMTVIDGDLDGTGIDKIRMKIYNKKTGQVYYDNEPGASDAANPKTAIGANSSIVVQNNSGVASAARIGGEMEVDQTSTLQALEISVQPNPARSYFRLSIQSSNVKDKITMQVFDANGRLIEVRNNINAGSTLQIGNLYRPGAYYAKIFQGKEHREIKLIKISD